MSPFCRFRPACVPGLVLMLSSLSAQASPSGAAVQATDLDRVSVTATPLSIDLGHAERADAGALGVQRLLDTPFSIDAINGELIRDRQASDINAAFRGDASVTPISSGYTSETSTFSVRGLQLDTLNGYHIDGLAVPSWASDLPLEAFQRISLLKGLGGFMYGFGQPGGMLDFQVKRPGDRDRGRLRLGYASGGTWTEEADLAGRAGARRQFGARLDAVHEEGDTFVDRSSIRRDAASLGLDWKVSGNVDWHADGIYQKRQVRGAPYGIIPCQDFGMCAADGPDAVHVPAPLDGSRRTVSTATGYMTTFAFADTGVTWRLSPDWALRVDAGRSRQDRTNHDSAILLLDDTGSYGEYQYLGYTDWVYDTAQAILSGTVHTGPVTHDIVAGANWLNQTTRYAPDTFTHDSYLGFANLADPGNFPAYIAPLARDLRRQQVIVQRAVFASDTLHFGAHWRALLGLRAMDYRQDGYNYFSDGARNAHYVRQEATPTLALMYKPHADTTVYASYVEGLEAGTSVGTQYRNAGRVYGPMRSRQYQVGGKLERGGWTLDSALFRIERGLYYTRDGYYLQGGRARFDGLELSTRGPLTDALAVTTGVMWLDAVNRRADPSIQGKRAYGAPRWQASLGLEYAVPGVPGLALGVDGRYVGDRPLEADNSNIVGAYHVFDAGVRYRTRYGGHGVVWRLSVDNLTDRAYWLTSWQSILNQGTPRVLRAGVQVDL